MIKHEAAQNNKQLREQLYQGDIYKLATSQASLMLAKDVSKLLCQCFNTEQLDKLHDVLTDTQFFTAMKEVRKQLFTNQYYIDLLREVITSLGFSKEKTIFEPLRLRAMRHNGHTKPEAAAVYYPHRDTWYAHPQCTIVGWIPLHDQNQEQTFEIFPDWLTKPVPNDSEVFDYQQWCAKNWDKKIGWQNKKTGLTARYPQTTSQVELGKRIGFSCKQAEQLLFSGAHFHQTLQQTNHLTRLSVDFRVVDIDDLKANLGVANVDNRSVGLATKDYIKL
ncbi:hypothetical protein [Aliikangiella sp. IMCC44359]|uniref:hypothetical protein n=1 Tax=Aliikangiella sp. IMCC44359 TaxID=3459125 RepID=UPI00403A9A6F